MSESDVAIHRTGFRVVSTEMTDGVHVEVSLVRSRADQWKGEVSAQFICQPSQLEQMIRSAKAELLRQIQPKSHEEIQLHIHGFYRD